ncbi:MAG TPA: ABC transporter permease [Nocardioidaceae bacterium]|nr:ABC transporter permease [Nocardioidaceae bacterium]
MATLAARVMPLPFYGGGWRVVERNYLVYKRAWIVFLTGFLEPVLYLFSIGVGVADLVNKFELPDGTMIGYTEFVAPALLASAAMQGALFDSTFNIFFRMKYAKLYDAILATPLRPWDVATGEVTWALLRGTAYSAMFVVVMVALGLTSSWWTVLTLPAAMLIGYAFAGAGMALTTWMKSWQDFEYIQLVVVPLFLFSGTFYPVDTYPTWLQGIVEVTPLYQGVVLCRGFATGSFVVWEMLVAVAYLAAMGTLGMWVASRRLGKLLLH